MKLEVQNSLKRAALALQHAQDAEVACRDEDVRAWLAEAIKHATNGLMWAVSDVGKDNQ